MKNKKLMYMHQNVALTYDDVQLVPLKTDIESRLDVDISSKKLDLEVPVMAASMDTIAEFEMAKVMSESGGICIIHRFQDTEKRYEMVKKAADSGYKVGVAIGLKEDSRDLEKLFDVADIVSLDIAHAHNEKVFTLIKGISYLSDRKAKLMVGNIATREAAIDLIKFPNVDILKVGIGGGSICTTRMVTGFGIPNVTALDEIKYEVKCSKMDDKISIIADGGIKNLCDIPKAIAAGADGVMIGSMLAGTKETPGQCIQDERGFNFKVYRGMASKETQEDYGRLKRGTVAEGVSTRVPLKGSAKQVIEDIAGALRSSFTYAGARNIEQFYNKTEFIRVTNAGIVEASAHIFKG